MILLCIHIASIGQQREDETGVRIKIQTAQDTVGKPLMAENQFAGKEILDPFHIQTIGRICLYVSATGLR